MPLGPARDEARLKALRTAYETVVTERLVEAEVKTQGIEITDAQIDAAIDDVKKRNNLSDDMLRQALASEGMSIASYRARLRKDFENHLLISAKVQNRVKVTDEDVRNYYNSHQAEFAGEEQVRLRLILLQVKTGAPPEEEARVKAAGETLLVRLAAGEDFAELARQVSQGPGASSGGDLGWVKKGTMPIDLERVAFLLQPGQNSGLVRAKAGWIILKAEDRRTAKAPPLEDVRERIKEKLGAQQAESYRKQYVDELRREAVIEVKMPELVNAPAS
jgi:peptidyl-prolyl cis-trans isomerase SurA